MYQAKRINISREKHPGIYEYLDSLCHAANNLRNAALFRVRQVLTMTEKAETAYTSNEKEVFNEIKKALPLMGSRYRMPEKGKSFLSYPFLNQLLKVTENPDYHNPDLPRQSAQQTLKILVQEMKSFYAVVKDYAKDPEKYTGRPKLPGYGRSGGMNTAILTNQDCKVYGNMTEGYELKLPLLKERLSLGNITIEGILKQVTVTPCHGIFILTLVIDDGVLPPELKKADRIISIDPGINNIAAITNNIGKPCLLFKGGAVKSMNQWYNKKMAEYQAKQTKGKTEKFIPTGKSEKLCIWRENHLRDFLHKTACEILRYCREWEIDTIVIGHNKLQKQKIRIGHENNQSFTEIPFDRLRQYIRYRAEREGIQVIDQEESYTSKASFPDKDMIPVYGKENSEPSFSGKRIKRGLYRTKDGQIINADLNGAANILRKWKEDAFDKHLPHFDEIIVCRYPN